MKPVIHSQKHLVQVPISQITTGTRENIKLLESVANQDANAANEVVEGTVVKAIYVEMWIQNQGTLGEQIAILEKIPAAAPFPTFAQMATLHTYPNKKNILYTTQGLTPNDGVGNPIFILRDWFKIPKGKQRMGLGDKMILTIANVSSNDLNRCGLAIFKELS